MSVHWAKKLYENFDINASLEKLDGEFDLNFLVKTEDNDKYILKVMRVGCDPSLINMQCAAIRSVEGKNLFTPAIITTNSATDFATLIDENGHERLVWLIKAIDGICYAKIMPKSINLANDLGSKIGALSKALEKFDHPYLDRDFKWNLMQANWITEHLNLIQDSPRKNILVNIIKEYTSVLNEAKKLPYFAIHNDLNDYNILVTSNILDGVKVSGLIDFGDMVRGPHICEVAIACAYIILDQDNPISILSNFVGSYHQKNSLTEDELELLFIFIKMRLAVSVVNSTLMGKNNPNDPYIKISQAPAWRFLEQKFDEHMILASLRVACGFEVTKNAKRVMTYLDEGRGSFSEIFKVNLENASFGDLSVFGTAVPENPFKIDPNEAANIGADINSDYWLGLWGEPRLIYTSKAFSNGKYNNSGRRSVHLGVDVFTDHGHEISAPLNGVVWAVENHNHHLDYGGVVILEHHNNFGDKFYSLYGHLNPNVVNQLTIGQEIKAGEIFCELGSKHNNGGWAPHLHFQIFLCLECMDSNWPGVCDPDELKIWSKLCPNPASLLNLSDTKTAYKKINETAIKEERKNNFGGNLKLSYKNPLMFVRGWKNYLFDQMGRTYLDAYNNVPHVGHSHPRIQKVVTKQLQQLNTNTRYLHPILNEFSKLILDTMPKELNVCYFVNSGSEANELALRLARTATDGEDIITPDHGYHGNTNAAVEVSAYKFNKPNGIGRKPWVHLVDVADDYRGKFRRNDPNRANKYADLINNALNQIEFRDGKLAGFISETFPSVGGQIIPPDGYLSEVYKKIRNAGGICIADEVQTGLGRLGSFFYGFEQQKVLPDIVVLGKPIGNGHPIGVVITKKEIAEKFDNGIEFFSTFGGSTLSCKIGVEVLKIIQDEKLQNNAFLRGKRLLDGLRKLQDKHTLIGDVRGFGLFVGVELVIDKNLTPATQIATYIVNRLRDMRILIGVEGPNDNILKIRPPLTVNDNDIDCILIGLDECLSEAEMFTS